MPNGSTAHPKVLDLYLYLKVSIS